MKATTILTALSGAFIIGTQPVIATCYGSGDSWPSTEEARGFVDYACKSPGGMFTGYFSPHQTKYMCPRSSKNNLGLLFEVQNLNDHQGFDLGDDDCYMRLTNEIFGCSKGGTSTVAGWRFNADPGNC